MQNISVSFEQVTYLYQMTYLSKAVLLQHSAMKHYPIEVKITRPIPLIITKALEHFFMLIYPIIDDLKS